MEKEVLLDEELNQVSGGTIIISETQNAVAGLNEDQTLLSVRSEAVKAGIRHGENLNEEDFQAAGLSQAGLARPTVIGSEAKEVAKTTIRFKKPLVVSSVALSKLFGDRFK